EYHRSKAEGAREYAEAQRSSAERQRLNALETVQWLFNRYALVPFDRYQFDPETEETLRGLASRLERTGFDGEMFVMSHVGRFAYLETADGKGVRLATNESLRHLKRGESLTITTSEYARKLGERYSDQVKGMLKSPGAKFRIEGRSFGSDKNLSPYPNSIDDIDAWNRAALLNNRIQIQLIEKHRPVE